MMLGALVVLIAGGLFTAFGIILLISARISFKKSLSTLSWPSVEGEITRSVVKEKWKEIVAENCLMYTAEIVYTYQVHDLNYTSKTIAVANVTSNSWAKANELVQQFPEKCKVKVYYKPTDPSDSVLNPGVQAGSRLILVLGAVALVAGIALIYIASSEL